MNKAASITPATCIETTNVTISYGPTTVLHDVSLSLPTHQVTAIIGPSGCGKSSFLSAMNRLTDLIPGCVVDGTIQLDGMNIRNPQVDVMSLRRRVGMIFQRPNPFPLSIARNLDLPLADHGISSRSERADRVEHALRDVGLWDEVADRLDAPAQSLSGGQQQRLCIARALVLNPQVLLFDEPCSALDPIAGRVVEELIASLRDRCTVVIVTHNLGQAHRIADRVAFFWYDSAGYLAETAATNDLFDNPQNPLTRDYLQGVKG